MSEELIWNFSYAISTKKRYSSGSLVHYRSVARDFLHWLTGNGFTLEQANPQVVQDYLRFYRSRHRYKRALWSHLPPLKSFARFAVERGLLSQDPTHGISCAWLDAPGGFPAYQGALRKLFNRPAAILKNRLPLFAPYWEDYLTQMLGRGHTRGTVKQLVPHVSRFHRYLTQRRTRSLFKVRPGILEAFLRKYEGESRRRTGRHWGLNHRRHVRRAIHQFLIFAFQKRGKYFHRPNPIRDSRSLPKELLYQFLDFCRTHKGLKEATLAGWTHLLLRFRNFLERHGVRTIEAVTVPTLDAFLLAQTKRMIPTSVNDYVAVLRAFFTYLYLHERFPLDIARCVQSPCQFRRNRYPKYLPWSQIEAVLAGIDRSTPVGKRDYALLSMLSRHGLRACEVARLHLTDIHSDDASFTLRERKNGISTCQPLAPEAIEALQDYLPTRPACAFPHLFLTHRAPFRPLRAYTLGFVASKYLRERLGTSLPRYGAYLFRHSFAKAMLDRGASLPDIGAMLGHRSLDSTLAYTQINTEGLREASNNYADLL